MSLYRSYSETDLAAEIEDLKARIIAAGKSTQGGVKSIAGEGRRMEFFGKGGGVDVGSLESLLAKAEAEWNRRFGNNQAIGVRF